MLVSSCLLLIYILSIKLASWQYVDEKERRKIYNEPQKEEPTAGSLLPISFLYTN